MSNYSNLPLSQRIARANAATECEKVMSLHVYWHAAGIHREEYQQYWSKRQDITWAHGFGQMGNRWTYWKRYVLDQETNTFATFRRVLNKYPEVAEAPDYRTISEMSNHYLTSQIIEVAEDAQSCKALFYTPGFINSFCTDNGKCRGTMLWERYGADFIYEDGKWVYLNLRVCPDIGGAIGRGGFGEPREMAPPPPPQGDGDNAPPQRPAEDPLEIPGPLYNQWSPLRVPPDDPPVPVPYKTLSDVKLYSDVKTLVD